MIVSNMSFLEVDNGNKIPEFLIIKSVITELLDRIFPVRNDRRKRK